MKPDVVVITGCTRGLGLALVRGFAEAGWTVAGCGRNVSVLSQLRQAFPAPHLFERCDVTKPGDAAGFAESVRETTGPPALLLNNAAAINRNAPLWEVEEAEFAGVVAVNLLGVHHILRAFLPDMIARGRGVIVNFSSGWGRSTSPEVAPYCATKWAVEGLTSALAQELPRGLAAVALNPGIIDTEMLRSCFGESAGAYETPDEWARRAVPFLAGLSAAENGRSLTVPGAAR